MRPSRRSFLTRGLAAAGGLTLATPFEGLAQRLAEGGPSGAIAAWPWGPLEPVADLTTGLPLLMLPAGFRYRSLGWTLDPMDDGTLTPPRHDGMACFRAADGRLVLVRNHELDGGAPFAAPEITYDEATGGGTVTLRIEPRRGIVESRASLSGTLRNCAGGATPWGSWLTCEETLGVGLLEHGWVFEVPVGGSSRPEPLRPMGRFVHEAVAVDPRDGVVYETEDANPAGLYRYLPDVPGRLEAGGRLQMLGVSDQPDYDTRFGQVVGADLPVTWVDIEDPEAQSQNVPSQGFEQGAASFARLEGAIYDRGLVYVVSTNGGDAGAGQVWALDPRQDHLRLIFESNDPQLVNGIDNICATPGGDLVLCQDGFGPQHVYVLLGDGRVAPFARNNVILDGERNGIQGDFRGSEFAGCTFSPDGRWLFFNVQEPGITFMVTAPRRAIHHRGGLADA